jgi:Asp-tRNA(Asn)/Glu-tRNA(Gln) amidotransferase A subunit family amidase
VALNEDATLAQAKAADALIAAGKGGAGRRAHRAQGHLRHRDFPTTAASKMLAGYQSPFDATVVRKLAEAGVVTLGKLNCDEFAMGSANENSAVAPVGFDAPPVRNPWDTTACPAARRAARRRRGRAPGARRHRHRHRRLHPPARRSAASPASSPPTAAPAATA